MVMVMGKLSVHSAYLWEGSLWELLPSPYVQSPVGHSRAKASCKRVSGAGQAHNRSLEHSRPCGKKYHFLHLVKQERRTSFSYYASPSGTMATTSTTSVIKWRLLIQAVPMAFHLPLQRVNWVSGRCMPC